MGLTLYMLLLFQLKSFIGLLAEVTAQLFLFLTLILDIFFTSSLTLFTFSLHFIISFKTSRREGEAGVLSGGTVDGLGRL